MMDITVDNENFLLSFGEDCDVNLTLEQAYDLFWKLKRALDPFESARGG
jgi:hypothetical protein